MNRYMKNPEASAEVIYIGGISSSSPLFYNPFSIDGSRRIETLEQDRAIIEERGGIHFINQSLLLRGGISDQELNAEFKSLVDSIIG